MTNNRPFRARAVRKASGARGASSGSATSAGRSRGLGRDGMVLEPVRNSMRIPHQRPLDRMVLDGVER
jgi:hypothetical protein